MSSSKSSTLALALKGFFLDYVPRQRALSPLTLQSYRDSLKLLLQFASGEHGDPSQLAVDQLSVGKVTAFLQSLETSRKNRASTRNVRLSAIHSFFRYLGGQYPEHLDQAQRILSIPFSRNRPRHAWPHGRRRPFRHRAHTTGYPGNGSRGRFLVVL